jgi:hypothetical protein
MLTSCDVQVLKTPSAKVTVRVIEEDGTPITAARASCSGGIGTPGKRQADGFTIAPSGEFTATINSQEGRVRASASKQGYYHNGCDYRSVQKASADPFESHKSGKWNGGDQRFEIILRPIKNPVPMYAKALRAEKIPKKEAWIGYDLEAGDWVVPHGKGKTADFEFYSEGTVESNVEYNGILFVRVPGEGNGIQALDISPDLQYCQFKSPYDAPESGYLKEWSWRDIRESKGREFSEITDEGFPNRMFIFRVRSEIDEWGRVIKAMYGKIYGPVKYGVRSNSFNAVFYLNPDYTRNLEFDPKRNLFPQNPRTGQEYHP